MGRFYNAIQAAKYIGCDPKTVRRMLKRGELTGERTERGWARNSRGQSSMQRSSGKRSKPNLHRPWLSKESPPEAA